MKDMYMEMLIADMERDRQEIRAKIFGLIEKAMKEDDWDTVRQYGYYSADIAADMLHTYGHLFSHEYKCKIALYHFDDKGDSYPIIRRFVKESRKYRPENWREELPESVRNLNTFTVYRAGVLENSDCVVCPVCGMYAYLYSKGSQWMCHDCNSDGDILDYCVMSGLFSDKRTALGSLCRQYGIKRSELEMLPADKLMGMQFKEEPAIIEGLLCPGLTMIYGSPKVGKSWLVLQIAVAVSKGEDFWSRKTQQGKVVYLALEDTYRRLKSRLSAQTDTIDDNLQFVIDSESLGNGLEMQLHNLMKSHPDTKLIIIDTFQRIRSPESNQYSYADDYREVDILKQFAAQHEIAVILVHHKRKMKASDPLDEVSGTNGLTGSADTLMILTRKKRTSRTGTLVVSGRDLPGEEYDMAFSNTSMCWELLRVKNDMNCGNEIIETVSIFISEKKEWSGTATELLAELTALTPNISVKANRLSAVLIDARNELFADYGIAITRGRTSSKKTISLRLLENDGNDAGDRDDANDGGDDTAAVSLPEIA